MLLARDVNGEREDIRVRSLLDDLHVPLLMGPYDDDALKTHNTVYIVCKDVKGWVDWYEARLHLFTYFTFHLVTPKTLIQMNSSIHLGSSKPQVPNDVIPYRIRCRLQCSIAPFLDLHSISQSRSIDSRPLRRSASRRITVGNENDSILVALQNAIITNGKNTEDFKEF